MNVLQNLTVFYNQLPTDSTYRSVCNGILQNLEEAAGGTVYDLAELTHSSRTTIWRMIQKLGYESFSDFHHELKNAVRSYTYYNRILPEGECQNTQAVRDALLSQMNSAYEDLQRQLDTRELEAVAQSVYESDRIRFYTSFQSSAIYSFQQNLAMSGKETACYRLLPDMIKDSQTLTDQSLVFIHTIEHAETMDLKQVFESINEQGASIFGVGASKSKYREYMDRILMENDNGKIVESMLSFDVYFYMLSEIYRLKYIDGKI